MESKPTDPASASLLLTANGRPVSSDAPTHGTSIANLEHRAHADAASRAKRKSTKPPPILNGSQSPQNSNNQLDSPPKQRKIAWTQQQQQKTSLQTHKIEAKSNMQPSPLASPRHTFAANVAGRSTPARVFKMDRFRVLTPAFATIGTNPAPLNDMKRGETPVIDPTGGYVMGRATVASPLSSTDSGSSQGAISASSLLPSPSPAPLSSSLMHPHHMLEMLRTHRMPLAYPAFFTRRFRESITRQASSRTPPETDASLPVTRLSVVPWGEWKRQNKSGRPQALAGDEEEVDDVEERETEKVILTEKSELPKQCTHVDPDPRVEAVSSPQESVMCSLNQTPDTPEIKRQRLREILHSPIEPFEKNTQNLRALAQRVNESTMETLGYELQSLTREEGRVREQLHSFIQDERDRLPLKFLFALPGGAAYCQHRMRRAMALWILTFEQNQQRLALLQWKALVENARFAERGAVYHAQAVQMRLRVAIAFVVRGFQQQALRRWAYVVQTEIWLARDHAARMIQARTRQLLTRLRTLYAHRCARFGKKPPHGFPILRDDIELAPPREKVIFRVPLEIRLELRARWRSAVCVQRTLRRRRFRRFLARYRVAATKMQSIARMRAERARYKVIRTQVIAFQARVRMVACRTVYVNLREAALMVQRAFRDSRAQRLRRLVVCAYYRQHEHQLTSALLIQRFGRGFVGRRRAKHIRRENAERFHAALVVQRAWYRRNNEFSTFLLLGCLREQETEDLSFDKRVLVFTHSTSANHIRKAWLTFLRKKRDAAARKIQREVRALIARRCVRIVRARKIAQRRIKWFLRVRHSNRIGTATKIQFAWLRAVPGRLCRHLYSLRVQSDIAYAFQKFEQEYEASSRIQAVVRGHFKGRKLARRERSSRTIQRAVREFIKMKRHRQYMTELRTEAARGTASQLIDTAVQTVAAARLFYMNTAATHIQRITRGFVARCTVLTTVTRDQREHQMATRIQQIWRANAWRRVFVQRAKASRNILEAQRRRQSPSNPFRTLDRPDEVLKKMSELSSKYLDNSDDLCGMSVHEWLWRNGVSSVYGDTFQKRFPGSNGVDIDASLAVVAHLRELDVEACTARLRSIMSKVASISTTTPETTIDESTLEADVEALVTNLFARRTLREITQMRNQLDRDRNLHENHFRADTERLKQQLVVATNVKRHCQTELDNVLQEAEDFRRPPKALSVRRDVCLMDLKKAERGVEQISIALEVVKNRGQEFAKDLDHRRQVFEREMVPREDAAHASIEGFRILDTATVCDGSSCEQDLVAKAFFLEQFPGLEARAAAFVSTLASTRTLTTKVHLARFLHLSIQPNGIKSTTSELTLSDVKQTMPALVHFRFSAEQKQHDLLRFTAGAEILQLGLERLGELYEISLEALALGRNRKGDNLPRIEALIVDTLERSRSRSERLPLAEHRCRTLEAGANKITELSNATVKLQSLWRTRASKKLLLLLQKGHKRQTVKAKYVEERSHDYVTELWERERRREREQLDDFEREETKRLRQEALAQIPRFPFIYHTWDGWLGAYVYRKQETADPSEYEDYPHEVDGTDYELVERHSVYSMVEDGAVVRIQAQVRGNLARHLVLRLQRVRRRQKRRDVLALEWEASRQERSQLTTLSMTVDTVVDLQVKSWWKIRRQALSSAKRDQPSKPRNLTESAAISAPEFDRTMRPIFIQLERAYHRSVHADFRCDWNFPAAARSPDVYARSILELLSSVRSFHRATAPRSKVSSLTVRHTKSAMRFGWQQIIQDDAHYYLHASSGKTSWLPPDEYSFDENVAATTIQALARQLRAQRVRDELLSGSNFVEVVSTAVSRAVSLGSWIGFGLEGMTPSVALCFVGLAKNLSSLSSLQNSSVSTLAHVVTADDFRSIPPAVLKKELQWSSDDMSALQILPAINRRVKYPLSPTWSLATSQPETVYPPSSSNWWPSSLQFLPSARVITQLVAKRFPNQQGRVQNLVRAIAASKTLITYRQLEMHLRKYGGRPDEAASALSMREIADLAPLERAAKQERIVFYVLARALDRAIVLTANLELTALCHELSTVRMTVWALVESDGENDNSLKFERVRMTLPLSNVSSSDLQKERQQVICRPPFKGMWEHCIQADGQTPSLSFAQAALYIRERGLEQVLRWERFARLCQSLVRMKPVRRSFIEWKLTRLESAKIIQRVYRGQLDRELAARLASQRMSDFVQARDPRSGAFYYVYSPTGERFMDEPIDANGRAVPFRPLVRDRLTQRWVLAWPGFDKSKRKSGVGGSSIGTEEISQARSCSVCRVARAARRCNECASPSTGDFMDFCLACFADAHSVEQHSFTALARSSAPFFRCIECRRPSTRRCLPCNEHYCARCFHRVHARGNRRTSHKSEAYMSKAAGCADCEARVAEYKCLACQDALCHSCLERSHGSSEKPSTKKKRSDHPTEKIVQTLEDPERESYCSQCSVRRGDERCPFCCCALCAVCLEERREAHAEALGCPETALELARVRVLGKDALCVECGKPADRECTSCNDRYCSVRWMGNSGCFERFHSKGARSKHEWRDWYRPEEDESTILAEMKELAAIEEQVRAKRREDAKAAELEAAALAAALQVDRSGEKKSKVTRKKSSRKKKPKKKAGDCKEAECSIPAVSTVLPFCETHLTPQLALAVAKGDPLEAAKLLVDAEREALERKSGESVGKRLAKMLTALRGLASPRKAETRAANDTTGDSARKVEKKKRKKARLRPEETTTTIE